MSPHKYNLPNEHYIHIKSLVNAYGKSKLHETFKLIDGRLDDILFINSPNYPLPAFISRDKLPSISEDMLLLYSKLLKDNPPINYSDNIDKARDPLTLSLLITKSDLLNFINRNQ